MAEEALRKLMDEHGDYLLKVAFYYCKNWGYAEEIVQDVFVKFYKKNEQFKEQANIRTYLTKMTINQSKDYLKAGVIKSNFFLEKVLTKQFLIRLLNFLIKKYGKMKC